MARKQETEANIGDTDHLDSDMTELTALPTRTGSSLPTCHDGDDLVYVVQKGPRQQNACVVWEGSY